ncbi:BglG family transcription antiterminator [Peptostreptococcus canis]|uniref:Transcription antiterminator n=1 Tax=Peptostreptococcus canis TaxID=1159213 RepID=A0ABR6TMN9_9FIRM|nr:BglG family transcription antiterminator [Peptostreptococcus canis]MBC2576690.1 transcription antiterminator [Peptostreptococcus canis]MBP1998461.1 lichenan operon transcriptional antiterminator [Peptostreptococcus canis]
MYETRIKKIFDILTEDMTFYTSEEIGNILKCSSRTVRDEIKNLNIILANHGAEVKTVSGKGCIFEISDKKKFEIFIKSEWHKYAFDKEDFNNPQARIEYILKVLLFSDVYLKVDDICNELLISRSQFNKDLKVVKSILKKYNLQIKSKPYSGIKICGSELNKRIAIANCLYKNKIKEENFFDLSDENNEKLLNSIRNIVIQSFLDNKYEITDIALNNLVIHLYIAIKRIKSGDRMNVEKSELIRLKSKEEYIIAVKITENLSELFDVQFPESEIAYISIHLLGKKISNESNVNSIPAEVEILIIEMLEKIKKEIYIDLTGDLDLRISLGLHITPLIDRLQYGLELGNPVLEDIRKDVLAFDAATIAVDVLNKKYNVVVSENEIGYIALHLSVAISRTNEKTNRKNILIICGSGIGTANMMKYRFLREFERYIDKLETCDYINAQKIDLDKYDLIVTSIPITKETKTTIIEVGSFLKKEDMLQIKPFMENNIGRLELKNLFSEKLFFTKLKLNNYFEVLKYLSDRINENIKLNGDLYESMLEREKLSITAFENGVAMPHPVKPLTNKTFITVAILDKPMKVNNKIVDLIILLNIREKEDSKEVEEFYYKLGAFMCDDEKILKAKKSKNLDEFLEIFAY